MSVNKYRVWCTNPTAHYEYVWNTSAPTVCPSDGGPIDSSLTATIETVSSTDTKITNFPRTAFGELSIAEMTPLIQVYFSYNNDPQLTKTAVTGIGTVTNNNSMVVVSSGASTNSSASLCTIKPIKYKSGQGLTMRFTGVFDAGVVGNDQMVGGFDTVDGLGFGFNGTDFGIFKRSHSVTVWVNQTDWCQDVLDGSGSSGVNINFGDGFGNVFQVSYQYLGFGAIQFFVENPSTGLFVLVHVIKYANTSTLPSFQTPSFPMSIESINTTNTTDIIVKSGSMVAGVEGKIIYTGPQENDSWLLVPISNGTETLISAYNSKTVFEGKMNKTITYPTFLSFATGDRDKPQILRIRKGATFTTPIWTDVITGVSSIEKLTGGTWNNDGDIILLQVIAGKGDPTNIDIEITSNSLFFTPGDNLIITAEGVNASGDNTGSISWLEDQ